MSFTCNQTKTNDLVKLMENLKISKKSIPLTKEQQNLLQHFNEWWAKEGSLNESLNDLTDMLNNMGIEENWEHLFKKITITKHKRPKCWKK